jgi:soluble lytic murein transglycosylase-like protein
MQFAELALACVLHFVAGGQSTQACQQKQIPEIANAVQEASSEFDVPPALIAAVIYHESRFRKLARGSRGEIGLMQLLRGGAVRGRYQRMSFAQLADIRLNVRLGTAYLAEVLPKCSSPAQGLARYNRGHGCMPSKYSTGVLADLRLGTAMASKVAE